MAEERKYLPVGTLVRLDGQREYIITGEPIGWGGGSILYPAQRRLWKNGAFVAEEISYVLKECYPASLGHSFSRNRQGEIVPANESAEELRYLQQVQVCQMEEGQISQRIYRTASRILPIRDCAQRVALTIPGQAEASVANTVTVMDSLAEKGCSLTAWMKERGRFTPAEAFRVIQQLLFALREVHRAGYLHLDIQDGNVFLRGTLEDKSELVTLIDFGCAREAINGKTAPIQDRVIFTTQGFSAPEILLHNDGKLQLGAEADLYSVGCLALYLLTGQRANVNELIANRTGNFLRPNQLRRIRCPKHLVDSMQWILKKALAREPENRYASADEMLADVTNLVDALQPYRTDLSSVRYDAFVCYKHGPVDSAAALTLQRSLENYRAPKSVSQKRKPFGRVFLDEGELSSCADLGQQIREALKNSGWLIVICSPDTPTSPWVRQEIDTFLEYHDRSRILAVLTGGDIASSFPPQLKADGNGVGEVFAPHALCSTPQEAAWKIKGDTLLKIIAPMLGTTYDTLKQRHRIYQLQRATAITAGFLLAAVGFAAYAVNRAAVIANQAVRIEQEYENALINESRFLVEQAQKRLDEDDPLGAAELALAALPSENQNRPVLTEAECVLGKALGIYTTPSSVLDTVTPVGKIETAYSAFCLDDTKKYLLAWDGNRLKPGIQVWNTESLCLVQELMTDALVAPTLLGAYDGAIFASNSKKITCMNFLSGKENWVWEAEEIRYASISEDRKTLIALTLGEPEAAKISILSAAGGTCTTLHSFPIPENQYLSSIKASPDLKWAIVETLKEDSMYGVFPYSYLYLMNLETGDFFLLLEDECSIEEVRFLGDRLYVIRSSGYTLTTNQGKTTFEYITPVTQYLEAYQPESGELLWNSQQVSYPKTTGIRAIEETHYDDSTTTGEGILFTYSNRCVLVDKQTGKTVREYELPDAVMDIQHMENGFETINANGWYSRVDYDIDYDTDTVVNLQYWNNQISAACSDGETFFVQSNPVFQKGFTIRKYQRDKWDDGYCVLWNSEKSSWQVYASRSTPEGTSILLARDHQVCLIDGKGKAIIRDIPEEISFSAYSQSGSISEDGTKLYLASTDWEDDSLWLDYKRFYVLDLLTGAMEEMPLPQKPVEELYVKGTVFFGDSLFFAFSQTVYSEDGNWTSNANYNVYEWSFTENTLTQRYRLTVDEAQEQIIFRSDWVEPERGRCALIIRNREDDSYRVLTIDLNTGEAVSTPVACLTESEETGLSWYLGPHFWNADGTRLFLLCGNSVSILGRDGQPERSIPVTGETANIWLSPDETSLFHYSKDNILTRYRVSDGMCLGSAAMNDYSVFGLSSAYKDNLSWEFIDENTLAVYTSREGFLLELSGETVKVKNTIEQCVGYDASHDRFLTFDGQELGSFPHYTLAQLIDKGNRLLGNPVQP